MALRGARAKWFWLLVGAALVGALGLLIWMVPGGGAWGYPPVGEHLGAALAALFAAAICLTAAVKTEVRAERWIFLGVSCLCWAIGEGVWAYYPVAHAARLTPLAAFTAPDVWFVASVPLAAIGLLLFPVAPRRASKAVQAILDGILGAGALMYVAWATALAPLYGASHASIATKLMSPSYPTGDLLLVCMALVLAAYSGSRMRGGIAWVTLGFVALAVPDIVAARLSILDSYSGPAINFLALGTVLGYLLIALGATMSIGADETPQYWSRRSERVSGSSFLAPYAPLALAGAITLERVLQHRPLGLLASLWGLALLVVLSIRQAIGFFDNMTVNRRLEDKVKTSIVELRAREARFSALVQNSSDVVTVVDQNGVVTFQSQSVQRVLGWDPKTSTGSSFLSFLHPTDQPRWSVTIERAVASPKSEAVAEWRVRHADGTWRSFQSVVTNMLDHPNVRGLVVNSRDITEQKALEDQLRHQAFHDPLTGLANRVLFAEHLQHAVRRRIRTGAGLAVLFIDIDDFKAINDLRGHTLGDELLQKVAGRLGDSLRQADVVARLGGDEFAVLLELEAVDPDPSVVANRLIENLSRAFHVGFAEVHVRASIGIAIDHGGESAEELLRNADLAMYAAKIRGKDTFEVYSSEMHSVILERMKMESDLRRALEQDEFVVHYQPIIDVSTRAVVDLEALVRWDRPEQGLLLPGDFIDVAEASGLIVPLGAWVLNKACEDMTKFFRRSDSCCDMGLSVNISRRQLSDPELLSTVQQALENSGMEAHDLTLEMTESAIIQNPVLAHEVMAQLRAIGVKIAIDDFGTGYSSLGSLRDMPLDILKIDRSFVTDISTRSDTARLAKTIMQLAVDFKLRTVAEGIEKADQLEELERLGCDCVQGFYFARPMAAEDLAENVLSPKQGTAKALAGSRGPLIDDPGPEGPLAAVTPPP